MYIFLLYRLMFSPKSVVACILSRVTLIYEEESSTYTYMFWGPVTHRIYLCIGAYLHFTLCEDFEAELLGYCKRYEKVTFTRSFLLFDNVNFDKERAPHFCT